MRSECPSSVQIAAFATSNIDELSAERISDHISECSKCETEIVQLERRRPAAWELLKQLQNVSPYEDEPAFRQLMSEKSTMHNQILNDTLVTKLRRQPNDAAIQLRDYLMLEQIGEGGMGAVYKAEHSRLKKTVAVKILSSARFRDAASVERFEREMEIVGQLDHPNIVRATDAGEEDNRHYLVMEYVDGETLSELVRRVGTLPIAEACRFIRDAALALHHAHELGLVHRDVKPSNMMVTRTGDSRTLKLLDLGLALLQDTRSTNELTTDGQLMGTIDYMAPEQANDSHLVDRRADIYSLGASLYKLLTGSTPHAGDAASTPLKKLAALANKAPVPIESVREDIPSRLAFVIRRMLAREPAQRFSTAAEAASALSEFCNDSPSSGLTPLAPNAPTGNKNVRRIWSLFGASAAGAVLLGLFTLTLRDPVYGDLRIEGPEGIAIRATKIDDPSESHVFSAGEKQSSLAVGQWKITIASEGFDDFELKTDSVDIKGPDGALVRITRRPQFDETAANASVDREFALWFLETRPDDSGAWLTILADGKTTAVHSESDLPKSFIVTEVGAILGTQPKVLEQISVLKNLRRLELQGLFENADFSLIPTQSLHALRLMNGQLNSRLVQQLRPSESLQDFYCDCQRMPDAHALATLQKRFPNLASLSIGRGTNLTEELAVALSRFRKLKALWISETKCTTAGLERLSEINTLQILNFFRVDFENENELQQLAQLPNLRTLSISRSARSPEFLDAFSGKELEELSFDNPPNQERAIEILERLPRLKQLSIDGLGWTDEHLKKIALIGKAPVLTLVPRWTSCSRQALEELKQLPAVKIVDAEDSAAPVDHQVAARLIESSAVVDGIDITGNIYYGGNNRGSNRRVRLRELPDADMSELKLTRIDLSRSVIKFDRFAEQIQRLDYPLERLTLPSHGEWSRKEFTASNIADRFQEVLAAPIP